MKKRITFAAIFAVIIGIIAFSVICPTVKGVEYLPQGEPLAVFTPENATVVSGGNIAADGTITTDGGICTLEFPEVEGTAKSVAVNYKEGSGHTVSFSIRGTTDGTFTDLEPVVTTIGIGQKAVVTTLFPTEYAAIRVEFPKDCVFDNVSLYETLPEERTCTMTLPLWRYALVICATLFAFACVFLLDFKFDIKNRVTTAINQGYRDILSFALIIGGSALLGAVGEIGYRKLLGNDSLDKPFNMASFMLAFAVIAIIATVIVYRKSFEAVPEKPLFLIIVSIGLFVIFCQPMGHICWDLDGHYSFAVDSSFFRIANYTEADLAIQYGTVLSTSPTYFDSEVAKHTLASMSDVTTLQKSVLPSLAHVPAGIAIALTRLFGFNFYIRFISGQLANLFVYATLVYFAVKKVKNGKMILATVALFPTNIYIACNYTYDYWVTGFALLGSAYFASIAEDSHKPYNIKDTVIMCAALMLSVIPKPVFIIMLLLPLFVRKNVVDKRRRRKYLGIVAIFLAITLAVLLSRSMFTFSSGGDIRGGEVDPTGQIALIFEQPLRYTVILLKFIAEYLSIGTMKQYISYFAYLGFGSLSAVFIAMLMFTALTDKCEFVRFKGSVLVRIAAALVLFGGACLAATSMYVTFTPVGSDVISGCQPRYVMPLLPALLLTVANPGLPILKNKKWIYNLLCTVVLSLALIYEIATCIAIPMM